MGAQLALRSAATDEFEQRTGRSGRVSPADGVDSLEAPVRAAGSRPIECATVGVRRAMGSAARLAINAGLTAAAWRRTPAPCSPGPGWRMEGG